MSSTPSGYSEGFSSTWARGKKCTPTPKQIHTGTHWYCPATPSTAAPHPNHTNAKKPSTATVTPRLRPVGK
jgi:hypothetical protein